MGKIPKEILEILAIIKEKTHIYANANITISLVVFNRLVEVGDTTTDKIVFLGDFAKLGSMVKFPLTPKYQCEWIINDNMVVVKLYDFSTEEENKNNV